MRELIEKCRKIAIRQHEGQFRRDGKTPYFSHIEDVVGRITNTIKPLLLNKRIDEFDAQGPCELICGAYLHDCFEDTDLNEDSLRQELSEFEKTRVDMIVNIVNKMTKSPGANYFDYIRNLFDQSMNTPYSNLIYMLKMCDIISNLSDSPTKKQVKKYSKALSIMMNMENSETEK